MSGLIRPVLVGALLVLANLPAQPVGAQSFTGSVVGHVVQCLDDVTGQESPVADVEVAVVGTSAVTRTDNTGAFTLDAIPIQAGADIAVVMSDGKLGPERTSVPIWASQTLDIGDLILGASIFGCGPDSDDPPVSGG